MVSYVSTFIFGSFSVIKFHCAEILVSLSFYKDGICSLIGTVLSVALFFNTLIIDRSPEHWWIDPLVAVGAGIAVSAATAVQSLMHSMPLFVIGALVLQIRNENQRCRWIIPRD
jgi:hypothetical protein